MSVPVTTAPLPDATGLWALLAGPLLDDATLAGPWLGGRQGGALWLSRTSWSLAAIGSWLAAERNVPRPKVWLPGAICNQSLGPLRRVADLAFYPVLAEDGRPDWDAVTAMARSRGSPDGFVLVHTFGVANDLAGAAAFARTHGCRLIEDAAHVLRPTAGIGGNGPESGDVVCYSPHKLLGVPDGAVMVARDPAVAAALAAAVKRLPDTAPPAATTRRWLAKRLSQRLAQGVLPEAAVRALARRAAGDDFLIDAGTPAALPATPRPSLTARRMLSAFATVPHRLEAMAARRREADAALRARLAMLPGLPDWRPLVESWGEAAPYRCVLRTNGPASAVEVFTRLRAAGFLAASWPDLPPEVVAEPDRHTGALARRRTCVLVGL